MHSAFGPRSCVVGYSSAYANIPLAELERHWLDIDGMSSDTDTVLISGVGIAGPTLAFWLKRGGSNPRCSNVLRGCGVAVTSSISGDSDTTLPSEWASRTQSSASATTCAKCALSMKAVGG